MWMKSIIGELMFEVIEEPDGIRYLLVDGMKYRVTEVEDDCIHLIDEKGNHHCWDL